MGAGIVRRRGGESAGMFEGLVGRRTPTLYPESRRRLVSCFIGAKYSDEAARSVGGSGGGGHDFDLELPLTVERIEQACEVRTGN